MQKRHRRRRLARKTAMQKRHLRLRLARKTVHRQLRDLQISWQHLRKCSNANNNTNQRQLVFVSVWLKLCEVEVKRSGRRENRQETRSEQCASGFYLVVIDLSDMFLTASNLVHYLIARKLICSSDVVDGSYSVVEAGRHNRNFKVFCGRKAGMFIKQIPVVDDLSKQAIRKEALGYQLARDFPRWNQWMLTLHDYDRNRHCLSLELLLDVQNLREFYYTQDRFPLHVSSLVAQSLADLHSVRIEEIEGYNHQSDFSKSTPWIFTYHDKPRFNPSSLSGGAVKLGEYIRQRPEFIALLDAVAARWQVQSLVHGDVKWDTFLLNWELHAPDSDHESATYRLKLIDWELLDIGDPAWDVAGILQAYLSHWIMRRYRDKSQSKEHLLELTYEKLTSAFPSIRCFWDTYVEHRSLVSSNLNEFLLHCVELSAVRLLQTTFESLFESEELTAHSLAMLSLSEQILTHPQQSAHLLFGLSV